MRSRPYIGPGLLIAILASVFFFTPRGPSAVLPTIPEGDALARRVSKTPTPPPLRKFEPSHLLDRSSEFGLRDSQVAKIEEIQRGWHRERDRLLESMQSFNPQRERRTLPALKAGLQDYSELSRRYEAVREASWQSALLTLDARQRALALGGQR